MTRVRRTRLWLACPFGALIFLVFSAPRLVPPVFAQAPESEAVAPADELAPAREALTPTVSPGAQPAEPPDRGEPLEQEPAAETEEGQPQRVQIESAQPSEAIPTRDPLVPSQPRAPSSAPVPDSPLPSEAIPTVDPWVPSQPRTPSSAPLPDSPLPSEAIPTVDPRTPSQPRAPSSAPVPDGAVEPKRAIPETK